MANGPIGGPVTVNRFKTVNFAKKRLVCRYGNDQIPCGLCSSHRHETKQSKSHMTKKIGCGPDFPAVGT